MTIKNILLRFLIKHTYIDTKTTYLFLSKFCCKEIEIYLDELKKEI